MKGDFSRSTFDPRDHYSGVRWQQGRPVTDADENEAQEIAAYWVETETVDVIGRSGAPRENPGFELSIGEDGNLLIGEGHLYVDGILCENDAPVAYPLQPDFPDPPEIPTLLGDTPLGLVYLEVFKRHLTYQDRDRIRDQALNGVDTTTRLQTVWQVRVAPLGSANLDPTVLGQLAEFAKGIATINQELAETTDPAQRAELIRQREGLRRQSEDLAAANGLGCDVDFPEWGETSASPTGALLASTVPGGTAEDPCDVPPGGGYLRGENQFYVVEVHTVPDGGGRNGSTFKWSRDNGSIVARIQAVGSATSGSATGTVFAVDSVQRDDYLGIHEQEWVEYLDDTTELLGQHGLLALVLEADKNLNRITLDRSLTVNLDAHPKLRKWNQTGADATDAGVAMNTTDAGSVLLEGGIQVSFTDGTYRPGDYWQFDARAVTGKISFPESAQPPAGIRRHYARLGIVAFSEEQLSVLLDCRKVFPPLTAITARDVAFDNTECDLPGVRTVQDAIDALCDRPSGGEAVPCFTVGKSGRFADLQQAVDELRSQGLRRICLCLMPGGTLIVDSLNVSAKPEEQFRLAIHGCPGARLELRQRWSINGLTSFELNDLDLYASDTVGAPKFLDVSRTGQFSMSNCRLSAYGEKETSLVGLSQVQQVSLRGSQLRYTEKRSIEIGIKVFEGTGLSQVFEPFTEFFLDDWAVRNALELLTGMGPTERKKLTGEMRRRLDEFGEAVTPEERTTFGIFLRALLDRVPQTRVVNGTLIAILQATSAASCALMIEDGEGDVTLEDNRFLGLVSLGGFPLMDTVPFDRLQSLADKIREREMRLAPEGGVFLASGNGFTGLVWNMEIWQMLEDLAGNEGIVIENTFGVATLSNNLFHRSYNQIAGSALSLTGNAFQGSNYPALLTAVSQISAFAGNTGPAVPNQNLAILNFSNISEQAANPGLPFNNI